MGGGSPPAFSASAAPLPLSQPQPTPSELERLDALVRYEFPTPPTREELVEALGAAHNSIHAAYHVLRTRRQQQQQQQQQQQATAAAAATTTTAAMATPSHKRRADETDHDAPSKRPREAASPSPPTARSLRLSSSQDAETAASPSSQAVSGGLGYLASLTSPQQQRKSPRPTFAADEEMRVVFSQRSLSQEAEASQEGSQEQPLPLAPSREIEVDVVLVPVADLVKAKRLLNNAVTAQRLNRAAPANSKWMAGFWDVFGAAGSAELEQRLETVVDAMVAWLLEFNDDEAAMRKVKVIELVVDIAAKLPRSDGAGELSQRVVQLEVTGDDSEVVAFQQELMNPGAQSSALTRSQAANRAITRLTDACAASMDRVVWFADANSANQAHQREIRAEIQLLLDRLAAVTEKCSVAVRSLDSAVAEARVTKETQSSQIRDLVLKRREELLASGETGVSAEVEAWLAVARSKDVEVAALMESRQQSGAKIREFEQCMKTTKLELAFLEKAAQLFATVRELREASLQTAMQSFEDLRVSSDERATDTLVRCVPVLTLALHKYYEFHSARQARAKAEVDEQQRALDTHVEYFGDSAPTTKDDLLKRIREFIGLISRSMQTILQVAEAQSRLWETRKEVLPRAVRHVVVREYGKLWRQLSGPVQDVMQKFVDRMRLEAEGDSDEPMTAVKAVPTPPRAASAMVATAAASPARVSSTQSSTQSSQSSVVDASEKSEKASSQVSAHVSPIRVVDVSMTQEVASFLRQAEPVSSTFAIASASEPAPSIVATPPKAPLVMTPVPPVPQIPVDDASAAPAADAEPHKFQVGTTLFTKFGVGRDERFVRGRVERLLPDGLYSVAYDNGDVFDVHPSYLHTEAQVERDLELHERSSRGASSSSSSRRDEGGCAVM